jgi:hypothetical protein
VLTPAGIVGYFSEFTRTTWPLLRGKKVTP